MQHLLYQHPRGLTVKEIADEYKVTVRTIYRDLDTLEHEYMFPISQEGRKRGVVEGCFLPPIFFTIPEAINIFLASRLMLNYAHRYDPNVASTFTKLNSIVPPPLRDQIQKTMEWMQKQPKDERYLRILATLADAWISQHQVRISYRALAEKKATARIIEPYFIEPAAPGHSSYVIAYCHRTKSLRTFKIERIEAIEATSEPYVILPDFDANAYLGSSWGIVVKDEVETIKLRFIPEIARIMEETVWHPSQVLERQSDSSIIMTLSVTNTVELYSWILGWGEKVEVLEPKELRERVARTAQAILDVYKKK
jgi:predicted DNA-binding transcriptional regulator YafY